MPASGPVIIRSSPSIWLTRVDLPALGRPTIASLSGAALVIVRPPRLRARALDVRAQRLEQIGDAFAMLGAERDRIAEAERDRLRGCPLSAGAAFGLVGDDDDRRRLGAQPAGDFLVERGEAVARVDQEQRGVGIAHRGFGLRAHPARQRLRDPHPRSRRYRSPGTRGRAGSPRPRGGRGSRRAGRRPARGACRPAG